MTKAVAETTETGDDEAAWIRLADRWRGIRRLAADLRLEADELDAHCDEWEAIIAANRSAACGG